MIRVWSRVVALTAAAAVVLSGCSGGHGSSVASIPQVQSTTSGASSSGTALPFLYGKQTLTQLPYVGPLQHPMGMSLAVYVKMANPAGLVQYAMSASDPSSGNYRRWLTPSQIGNQYGASVTDYKTVATYFKNFGLQVGGWPQREMLYVSGSTTQFAKAFGTTFGIYKYNNKQIVAPTSTPTFATSIPVVSALGVVGAPLPRRFFIKPNNNVFYGYAPQQLATGFDYSGAYSAGYNGSGIRVGIMGTGPILNSHGGDDDTAALGQYWHASMGSVVQVPAQPQNPSNANGQTGTAFTDNNPTGLTSPPPVTNPACSFSTPPNYNTCNPEDVEAQLDTESIASLAPGATTLFYLAYNANEFCYDPGSGNSVAATGLTCTAPYQPWPEEGIELTDDELQQAIADNLSDVVSISWGEPENIASDFGYIGPITSPGLGQVEYASLVAEGMAVFASSGDDGAWECLDPATNYQYYSGVACVNYPASDVNVVAVGGVNIPLDQSGNLTGLITAWADNTTLGGDGSFGNNVGSGGGISSTIAAPPWQVATIPSVATMRVLPDISLDADPNTGPSVVFDAAYGASVASIGGTSAAAPEAAAMWALVLQACKASATCNAGGTYGYRLGNPAPLFYSIYSTSSYSSASYKPGNFVPQLTYAQVFYDVTYGDNQAVPGPTAAPQPTPLGYNSGPGYDQVTGIGAPFAGHLIQAVTGTTVP